MHNPVKYDPTKLNIFLSSLVAQLSGTVYNVLGLGFCKQRSQLCVTGSSILVRACLEFILKKPSKRVL